MLVVVDGKFAFGLLYGKGKTTQGRRTTDTDPGGLSLSLSLSLLLIFH